MRCSKPYLCTGTLWIAGLLSAGWLLTISSAGAAESAASNAAQATTGEPRASSQVNDPQGILDLDIDQLAHVDVVAPSLNMEVSTVDRQESTVGRTAAAVFVITNEMIRRSGAQTIPDLLRLAPGVQVQQNNASEWSVSIRGLNATFFDKALVQIDGRCVYTPIFGGVFWDVQDLVLDDIERIEVIRGPGSTLWGANAVNGIINIITKKTSETQGGYFKGVTGTEERGITTARYGGKLGDDATWRVYGKWFDRGPNFDPDGDASDDWRQARTGFRMDWQPRQSDAFTLQGDYYNGVDGVEGNMPSLTSAPSLYDHYVEDRHVSGGNILGRWTHVVDKDTDWSLQMYYDRTERHDTELPLVWDTDTIDLDFQYRLPLASRHALIWGLGYRNYGDYTRGIPIVLELDPAKKNDNLYSFFVQDQIEIREDVFYFTVGSKFEHNDYTGFEIQPTVRFLWTPDKKHCIWGAISRAVQTPTRVMEAISKIDDPFFTQVNPFGQVPVFPVFHGTSAAQSAEMIAYELGMRAQPTKSFYWDLAVFYNNYRKLPGFLTGTPELEWFVPDWQPALFIPIDGVCNVPTETYGFELVAGYELNENWELRGAYSFLRMLAHEPAGETAFCWEGANARNVYYLWLSGDLGNHWSVDLIGRYFDTIRAPFVPMYFVADVRLAYRPRPNLEWAVVGRNLLEGPHLETSNSDLFGTIDTKVEPEVYVGVTYRF